MFLLAALQPQLRNTGVALVVGSIGGLLMNTLVVLPPLALGHAIDEATRFGVGGAAVDDVAWAALLVVLAALATEGPRAVKRWFLATGRQRIIAHVRADAVAGVLAWPVGQLLSTPVGELISRIGGDVDVLARSLKELFSETWDSVVFSLALLVAMALIDARLTLLFCVPPVLVAMLLSFFSGRVIRRRTHAARAHSAALVSAIHERLLGVRMLTLLGASDAAVDEVRQLSHAQAAANVDVVRLAGQLKGLYATLVHAGVVMVIVIGGTAVVEQRWTLGTFVAFLELYRRFVDRAHRIPQLVNALHSGGAAHQRLAPLLSSSSSSSSSLPAADALAASSPGPSQVRARGLCVRRADAAALAIDGLDLDVAAGAFIAVTGPVGAGKSTLARALVGLASPSAGSLLIDGAPVVAGAAGARIAFVPDDPQLFSGSVADNVGFGASGNAHLAAALHAAALDDDVAAFAAGVDTQIGELGVRVSDGQCKRIAVARAIAAAAPGWPALLVLDDPFSSVDTATELDMVRRLRALFGPTAPRERQATIVLLSHRLAAFPLADQVLVLERGRLVQAGTHQALVDVDGLYRRTFLAQQRTTATSR